MRSKAISYLRSSPWNRWWFKRGCFANTSAVALIMQAVIPSGRPSTFTWRRAASSAETSKSQHEVTGQWNRLARVSRS
jgi:hypothetical protein